jgi:cephalosporin hydroxylase
MAKGTDWLKEAAKRGYAAFYRHPRVVKTLTKHFHRAYYAADNTYLNSYWRGVRILKCPLDLWIYQEILETTLPDLLIETGTAHGGSAYYFASLFDLRGAGEVVTIDTSRMTALPAHPRITYLQGSSVAPAVLAQVRLMARGKHRVMVVLDSDHSEAHVMEELRLYSPLVTAGNYLVVEDTHMGHPVPPFSGKGPLAAVERFLERNDEFAIDPGCERLLMSFNYRGYLKRIKAARTPVAA